MRRARDEAGFTLPELLIAMVIGLLVLMAAFGLLDTAVGLQRTVTGRVDATQRGRHAMDLITRELRSQVCPTTRGQGSLVSATASSVSFWLDLSDGTGPVQKHTLRYDSGTRELLDDTDTGTGTQTSTLLENVVPEGTTPIFSYYAYDDTLTPPTPTRALSASLTPAEVALTSRIVVNYVARPTGATTTEENAAVLQDEVNLRSVNPSDSSPAPTCP